MTEKVRQILSSEQQVILKNFPGASFGKMLAGIQSREKNLLCCFTENAKTAERLSDEMQFFSPGSRIQVLPQYDVRPYYGLSPHRRVKMQHLKICHEIMAGQVDVLIVPVLSALRRTLPKDVFQAATRTVIKNDLIDRDVFLKDLVQIGYERSSVVEDPGQYAVRGDIIDVFSPQYDLPVRISFFDIEIEDIKFFQPDTQRTAGSLDQIQIIPAQEVFLEAFRHDSSAEAPVYFNSCNLNWKSDLKRLSDQKEITKNKRDQIEEFVQNGIYFQGIDFFLSLFYKETATLFSYLPGNAIYAFDLDSRFSEITLHYLSELAEVREDSDHIESIFAPQDIFVTPREIEEKLTLARRIYRGFGADPESNVAEFNGEIDSNLVLKTKLSARITEVHSLAPLAGELNQKRLDGYSCYIVCQNQIQLDRVEDLLKRFDLPLKKVSEDLQSDFMTTLTQNNASERLLVLLSGHLHEGFISHSDLQWWITDEEIFGKKTRRAVSKKRQSVVFSSFNELSVGDYLIHMDHGIGIYRGLVKLEYDVNENDFVQIEYLGGDKLYVPVDRLNRIQKYAAEEGASPLLDKLGGGTWIKTRDKAKKAARKLAKQLLEMQAMRQMQKGHAFGVHNQEMEEFASRFPFEETADQMSAIEDVSRDMESLRPMDRLICGDVGYGKTEVAMRAAFKAVSDRKQVCVLVPTTVLAFQHFTSFKERFKDYPVRVELMSRFRSNHEQGAVIGDLKQGKIDIIVGTHRLLSKDIKFSDLGLLVVDEEHRFGVIHKENIKKMRQLVDVVTLTATPIPRTLNFALNGIRDLSIINTPPVDRLAVRTYTCYFDEATVRDAILKEVRRGGQAYFVHNRVQSIEKMTARLKAMVPEARFRFGHGQMDEGQLETLMIDFMNHEFDVLVCTTIIESGLDIPNANTMIINRADGLGLAQLYQLRGRVGRSSHQAYCYLIIPEESLITQKARKRLAVIQKFTELGSGFKIASHDLEIRGAGNILGDEQSGHIAAIGYDLYLHLLNQAIAELNNQNLPEDFEPEIQVSVKAKIPDDMIADEQLRLVLYKQVSSMETADDLQAMHEEWQDRFGKLPNEVENLFKLIEIRILCKQLLMASLKQSGSQIFFGFHEKHSLDPQMFVRMIAKHPKKFSMSRDKRFVWTHNLSSDVELLNQLISILVQMSSGHFS